MTEPEVYELLQQVFESVFRRQDIKVTAEMTAHDVVGWDSIKQFDIIMEIEDRLSVEFNGSELSDLKNVGDLARLVQAQLKASGTSKPQ